MENKHIQIEVDGGRVIHVQRPVVVKSENGQPVRVVKIAKPLEGNKEEEPVIISKPRRVEPVRVHMDDGVVLRQENVQEILTAVPNWMIRWGNTLFCSLIILLLALAAWVQYPEVIDSKAVIVAENPAQIIQWPAEEKWVEFLVEEGARVEEGTPLVVVGREGKYADIQLLQVALSKVVVNSASFESTFPELPPLELGSLQLPYAQFEESYYQYQQTQNSPQPNKTQNLRHFRQLIQHHQALQSALNTWLTQHLITASIPGIAHSLNPTPNPQSPLIIIRPHTNPSYKAQLHLPALNAGKIKPDQPVHIKLDNYPSATFGLLEARVTDIQTDPHEPDHYLVEATLPDQLTSSYQKTLAFQEGMKGSGEIVIERSTLLRRFLGNLSF